VSLAEAVSLAAAEVVSVGVVSVLPPPLLLEPQAASSAMLAPTAKNRMAVFLM
jgi:hypothetical protein